VEAPRTDAPRLLLVPPAVAAGSAGAVLVVAGCEVEVVVQEAGLSGILNRLPNGALVVVVGAADEVSV